ncbi:MAG: hypothetical protein AAGA03_00345 [Planctomycetota bacterium]
MVQTGDQHLWEIRRGAHRYGPFPEVEFRKKLSELPEDGTEVRQGQSTWYPASQILDKFRQLQREGIYLHSKNRTQGPFTAARALEMLRQLDLRHVEGKIGKDAPWYPAKKLLEHLETLEAPESTKQTAKVPPPGRQAASETRTRSPKTATNPDPNADAQFRLTCPSCRAGVDVYGRDNGTTVPCPKCNQLIKVVIATGPTTDVAPVHDLDEPTIEPEIVEPDIIVPDVVQAEVNPVVQSASPVFGDVGPKTGHQLRPQPGAYAASPPGSANPYAATAMAPVASSGEDRTVHYVVPGVFIAIWSGLVLLGQVLGLVINGLTLVALLSNAPADFRAVGALVGLLVINVIFLALGGYMLMGAIAMIRRSGLQQARTATILATIPCIGCFVMPFGIWACCFIFSDKAKRDFSG